MESATNLDILWIIIAAAMVMLMQGGFTLLESGLVRAKNSINVAIKNFVDFCVSATIFWVFGFAIMFGTSFNGWFGTSNFFLGENASAGMLAFFLFQLVFAGTATTIVSGAVAERMRFGGYLTVSVLIATVIYPVIGHWVWGGLQDGLSTGWLAAMGFVDFAGATVVHSVGGWVALAAVILIGPRAGRFDTNVKIEGHNIPLATFGALILWFGWFGFNGGSTLAVNGQVPLVIVNTMLAGALAGMSGLVIGWIRTQQADIESVMNGALAGLVAITAAANLVSPLSAAGIGLVAGIVCIFLMGVLDRFKIDDAVGAFPVHVGGGVWGTLSVPLFVPVELLPAGSILGQLAVQFTGAFITFLWAFVLGLILLSIFNRLLPLRVSAEDEYVGLNVSEHGAQTALITLLDQMGEQTATGDMSLRVSVEPHTEVGQIASQHNSVLERLETLLTRSEKEKEDLNYNILKLLDEVSEAANGDLTAEAEVTADATGAIADAFNFMIEQLRDIILKVQDTAIEVNSAASQMESTASSLAERNENQVEQIVATTSAIDEMSASIQRVAENAAQSTSVSEQAQTNARQGARAVQDTIKGMSLIRRRVEETSDRMTRLSKSSEEIGQIVELIRDITKRTTILALNASIQASRAGSAGRGFAIVAEEVELLADRASGATVQIQEIIEGIQTETREAVEAMQLTATEVETGAIQANEAGRRLTEIESVSDRLATLIRDISSAAKQQARGSETIAVAMSSIANVSEDTANGTRDASRSISNLAILADDLADSVSTFKIAANGAH